MSLLNIRFFPLYLGQSLQSEITESKAIKFIERLMHIVAKLLSLQNGPICSSSSNVCAHLFQGASLATPSITVNIFIF